MGTQITAMCDCGLEAGVRVGGGMADFTTTCYFPCLCRNCHNIVQTNMLAKELRCPKCRTANPIPYDDPSVLGSLGKRIVADWNMQEDLGRVLTLTDGRYECPKCGKMSLTFTDQFVVLWD
jgi:hypothetical protein